MAAPRRPQQPESKSRRGPPPPARKAPPSGDPQTDAPREPTQSKRPKGGYTTGNDYPLKEGEVAKDAPPLGEDPPESSDPDADGQDIYGEDDPLPDEMEPEGDVNKDPEDSPEATRVGPPRKVVIVAGPDKGKVKRFTGVRMVVGRTAACQVQLSDNSVSRRHLELVQGSAGVMLRDLGSGNGSKVNGEKITEHLLRHDDEIEIGQTKLRYVDEVEAVRLAREEAERKEEEARRAKEEDEKRKAEEAVKAAEDAKKAEEAAKLAAANAPDPEITGFGHVQEVFKHFNTRQKMVIGLAAVAVLGVTFLVVPQLFHSTPAAVPDAREELANKKMDLARVALTEERYEDATNLIESAEKLHPGVDADGFGDRAKAGMAAQKGLTAARGFLDENKFDEARQALDSVPDSTAKANDQKKQLLDELNQKQTDYLQKSADEALSQLDVDSAKQIIAQLPDALQKPYLPKIAKAMKEMEHQEKQQHESEEKAIEQQKRSEHQAREQAIASQFEGVSRKFHMGDFDRASLEIDRVLDGTSDPEVRGRGQKLKRLIPEFARLWEDGEGKYRIQAMESAVRPLQKAKGIYDEIDLPGGIGSKLEDHLQQSFDEAGKAALQRGDISTAFQMFRGSQRLNSGDEQAREGMQRIHDRVHDLFMDAYIERDRNPREATEKFRMILEIAPKGSKEYSDSERELRTLSPR